MTAAARRLPRQFVESQPKLMTGRAFFELGTALSEVGAWDAARRHVARGAEMATRALPPEPHLGAMRLRQCFGSLPLVAASRAEGALAAAELARCVGELLDEARLAHAVDGGTNASAIATGARAPPPTAGGSDSGFALGLHPIDLFDVTAEIASLHLLVALVHDSPESDGSGAAQGKERVGRGGDGAASSVAGGNIDSAVVLTRVGELLRLASPQLMWRAPQLVPLPPPLTRVSASATTAGPAATLAAAAPAATTVRVAFVSGLVCEHPVGKLLLAALRSLQIESGFESESSDESASARVSSQSRGARRTPLSAARLAPRFHSMLFTFPSPTDAWTRAAAAAAHVHSVLPYGDAVTAREAVAAARPDVVIFIEWLDSATYQVPKMACFFV
jgi:hypothetical protein